MVTDSEPRYRLVDSNGNVVGSLFAESDGTLKLQEGTSGSDNEVSLATGGRLSLKEIELTGPRSRLVRGGEKEFTNVEQLADDSAFSVEHAGTPHITVSGATQAGTFQAGFNAINNLGSNGINVVGGGTTLDGTTGPDGNLNVSNDSNTFFVENRTGSSLTVKVIVK